MEQSRKATTIRSGRCKNTSFPARLVAIERKSQDGVGEEPLAVALLLLFRVFRTGGFCFFPPLLGAPGRGSSSLGDPGTFQPPRALLPRAFKGAAYTGGRAASAGWGSRGAWNLTSHHPQPSLAWVSYYAALRLVGEAPWLGVHEMRVGWFGHAGFGLCGLGLFVVVVWFAALLLGMGVVF